VDSAGGLTPPWRVLAMAGIVGLIPMRWVSPSTVATGCRPMG